MASTNESPQRTPDGFEGEIVGLGLSDVIQLNVHNHFSGCITVRYEQARGLLFFRDGEIIHAEQGGKVGEEAFYDILEWPAGRFSVQPNVVTTRSSIQKSCQHLLLDAHRVLDERRASRKGQPPPIPQPAPAAHRGSSDLAERLNRIQGVARAVLQTRDGLRVGDDSYEAEVLAGQAIYVAMVGKQLGSFFRAGEVASAAVQGAARHLLLFATKSHYLSVLVHGESQVGAVETEVRRAFAANR